MYIWVAFSSGRDNKFFGQFNLEFLVSSIWNWKGKKKSILSFSLLYEASLTLKHSLFPFASLDECLSVSSNTYEPILNGFSWYKREDKRKSL